LLTVQWTSSGSLKMQLRSSRCVAMYAVQIATQRKGAIPIVFLFSDAVIRTRSERCESTAGALPCSKQGWNCFCLRFRWLLWFCTVFSTSQIDSIAEKSHQFVMTYRCDRGAMLFRPYNARHTSRARAHLHGCMPCTSYRALPAAVKHFRAWPFWPGSPEIHSRDQACSLTASFMHAHAAGASVLHIFSIVTMAGDSSLEGAG
jgi:hypothetical protein